MLLATPADKAMPMCLWADCCLQLLSRMHSTAQEALFTHRALLSVCRHVWESESGGLCKQSPEESPGDDTQSKPKRLPKLSGITRHPSTAKPSVQDPEVLNYITTPRPADPLRLEALCLRILGPRLFPGMLNPTSYPTCPKLAAQTKGVEGL